MSNRSVLVSVVVCTYNRAQLLHNCLGSLNKQSIDKKHYEVIVVDNNSTDDTQNVVKKTIRHHPNIRLVTERNQGLSVARNRGWKEARGRYVAYIDDDALAEPNWIEQIVCFITNYPKVTVFGGPYSRFSIVPFPDWLPENYYTLNLGNKIKALNLRSEWLSGSNMIFGKSVFEKYGGFKKDFGMTGKKILYGEETELFVRLKKYGEPVYYVPKIRVRHIVSKHKLKLLWSLQNDFWHSFSYSVLIKSKLNLLKGFLSLMISVLLIPVCLLDFKKGIMRQRLYYYLSGIFVASGQIVGSVSKL